MLLPRPSSHEVEYSGVQIVEFQMLPSLFQYGAGAEKYCLVHLRSAGELSVACKTKCVGPESNWEGWGKKYHLLGCCYSCSLLLPSPFSLPRPVSTIL